MKPREMKPSDHAALAREGRESVLWRAGHELWGAARCQAADQHTIEVLGVPSSVLMERASLAVAKVVQELRLIAPSRAPGVLRVDVLCGSGNNGADGLAVARILAARGVSVRAWLCAERLGAATLQQRDLAAAYGVEILPRAPGSVAAKELLPHDSLEVKDGDVEAPPGVSTGGIDVREDEDQMSEELEPGDVVVDALLGTGAQGPARRGSILQAMTWLAACAAPCVAIDVPSCIDADTGAWRAPPQARFSAHATVTFERSKPGLHLSPGRSAVGALTIATIGLVAERQASSLPPDVCRVALDDQDMSWGAAEGASHARAALASHKGERGHVGVVGGTGPTPGAAILSALAALRAGCGLATVWSPPRTATLVGPAVTHAAAASSASSTAPRSSTPRLEDQAPEVMFTAREDSSVRAADVLVVGPGLRAQDADERASADDSLDPLDEVRIAALVRSLWHDDPRPMVFDASALAHLDGPSKGHAARIITPHPGEALGLLTRLCGPGAAWIEGQDAALWTKERLAGDRLLAAHTLAERLDAVVLLKGPGTVVVDGDRRAWIIDVDDSRLATAGSGDVLAGIIAALLGRGHQAGNACLCGALMHARAARHAGAQLASPTAGDLARSVGVLEQSDVTPVWPQAGSVRVVES